MTAREALHQIDALARSSRFHAARAACEHALDAFPDDAALHERLGAICFMMRHHERAVAALRRALDLDPRARTAATTLSLALRDAGRPEEGVEVLRSEAERRPDDLIVRSMLAELLRHVGRAGEAYELLRPVVRADRAAHPAVALAFARVNADLKRPAEGVALLERTLAEASISPALRVECLHAWGDLLDAMGEYDLAFTRYQEANSASPSAFDAGAHVRHVDRMISGWTRANTARIPRARSERAASDRPVFIVGMPRSGTTLLEQILDRHDDVHGAGELSYLGEIAARIELGLPPGLAPGEDPPAPLAFFHSREKLTLAVVDAAGEAYVDRLLGHVPAHASPRRVSNKQPLSFHHLGLISRVLPGARVIHCVREPLDTCVSCFFNRFAGSNPTTSLVHLGKTYRAYERLMKHWRSALDLPVLDVHYEDLVADQEAATRRAVEFLGLDWARGGEACLNFHQSRRVANTPSVSQVREPMYTRSVGRWRHYEKHLAPLRKALAG